jgi:hypothetical protein
MIQSFQVINENQDSLQIMFLKNQTRSELKKDATPEGMAKFRI